METAASAIPFLSHPAGRTLRIAGATSAALGALLVFYAAWIRPGLSLQNVVPESGLIDPSQPWIWACTGLLAALGCLRTHARRDVLFFMWLGFLCVLAGLRELDLHVLLNPSNIHLLGLEEHHAVRFRSRWWMSADTSLMLRAMWLILFLAGAALLFAPFIAAQVRWKKLALARDPFAWTFAIAFAFLAGGYVIDDIILRLSDTPRSSVKQLEELSELIGQLILIGAIILAIRKSPYQRARPLFARSI